MSTARHPRRQPEHTTAVVRFARAYGWWRVVAIPVLAIITVWVLVDITTSPSPSEEEGAAASPSTASATERIGPDPATASEAKRGAEDLPPGGAYAEQGDDTYRDTAAYGGDAACASMVDFTLGDPRGWTAQGDFEFIHVAAADNPDTRIRLTSLGTTATLCGSSLHTENSCHTGITGESTVNLNESRWVRGAVPYEGDLGNYRQYLINHEFGHAIGYASHQPCGGQGKLAPVMMQQTLSLNNAELYELDSKEIYPDEDVTCEPNPWPYPSPASQDPENPA